MTTRSTGATTAPAPVAGVIVAGGRASRMGGRDKAFAAVGGEPIVVRTIRLFHELFPQVLVRYVPQHVRLPADDKRLRRRVIVGGDFDLIRARRRLRTA